MTTGHADALILFGITGNLARTRLFPALYALAWSGDLNMPIVGVSKTEGDDADLRRRAEEALVEAGIEVDKSVFERFTSRLCYVSGDYRDPATYDAIKNRLGDITMTVAYSWKTRTGSSVLRIDTAGTSRIFEVRPAAAASATAGAEEAKSGRWCSPRP